MRSASRSCNWRISIIWQMMGPASDPRWISASDTPCLNLSSGLRNYGSGLSNLARMRRQNFPDCSSQKSAPMSDRRSFLLGSTIIGRVIKSLRSVRLRASCCKTNIKEALIHEYMYELYDYIYIRFRKISWDSKKPPQTDSSLDEVALIFSMNSSLFRCRSGLGRVYHLSADSAS